jgi:hypothetical protein
MRRIGDWLTDGVTSPWRLMRIMSVWLLLSTYVFSLPENLGLSEPGYLTLPSDERYVTPHPPAESWGLAGGFWTALHFHVPVAAFTARDEWEPASDRPMVLGPVPSGGRPMSLAISAEDYANLVLIAHWIMWPVVIVLASRRFLRRAQQQ